MHWVASRPPHVNINIVQLMPTGQAFGPLAVHRTNSSFLPAPKSFAFGAQSITPYGEYKGGCIDHRSR